MNRAPVIMMPEPRTGLRASMLFFPPAVSLTLLTFATLPSVLKPWGRLRRPT